MTHFAESYYVYDVKAKLWLILNELFQGFIFWLKESANTCAMEEQHSKTLVHENDWFSAIKLQLYSIGLVAFNTPFIS
jgi:hypothetical protein